MNTVSFVLDELTVSLQRFKATARSLVHSILFLRMVELVRPVEMSPPEFETIEYVMNPRFQHSVEEELEKLRGLLRKKKFIQLTLSLYRIVKEAGWFTSEERVEWERWTIPFRLSRDIERNESIVSDRIGVIHHYSNRFSDHIPNGKNIFLLYDASEEKGWTFADLADLLRKGPPSVF